MKRVLGLLVAIFIFTTVNLFAQKVTKKECQQKGDEYIFAGSECVQFAISEGDTEGSLTVVVHGTWDAGTNTLGRYAPFTESLAMATDVTTIAIALPGYSNTSTNKLKPLSHKTKKNLAATKDYVLFLGKVINALKEKYKAKIVNVVGHSAGAMMVGTLTGFKPRLIQNVMLAGGRYDIHAVSKDDSLVSMIDIMESINKKTNFLFVYGTDDKISKPEVTTEFFKLVEEKGLNAKLVKVEGAGHIDLDMSDEAVEAFSEMIEKE